MKSICEEIGYLWMQGKSSVRIQDVLEMSIMMAATVSGTGQSTATFLPGDWPSRSRDYPKSAISLGYYLVQREMSWIHGRPLSWGDSETWGLRGSVVRSPVAKLSPWEPWQVEIVRKKVLCRGGKRCRRESEEDTPKWSEWIWVMLRRVERSPNQIPKLAMGVSSCRHMSSVSSQEGLPYPVLVWGFP